MKSLLALALVASLGMSASAQTFNDDMDGFDELLVAQGACSYQKYKVESGRYSPEQVAWLRTVLNFIHSPVDIPGADYEEKSPTPVTADDFQKMRSSKAFQAWAGTTVLTRADNFFQKRRTLEQKRMDLPLRGTFGTPELKAYDQAHKALIQVLKTKFKVVQVTVKTCD